MHTVVLVPGQRCKQETSAVWKRLSSMFEVQSLQKYNRIRNEKIGSRKNKKSSLPRVRFSKKMGFKVKMSA